MNLDRFEMNEDFIKEFPKSIYFEKLTFNGYYVLDKSLYIPAENFPRCITLKYDFDDSVDKALIDKLLGEE